MLPHRSVWTGSGSPRIGRRFTWSTPRVSAASLAPISRGHLVRLAMPTRIPDVLAITSPPSACRSRHTPAHILRRPRTLQAPTAPPAPPSRTGPGGPPSAWAGFRSGSERGASCPLLLLHRLLALAHQPGVRVKERPLLGVHLVQAD